MPTLTLDLSDDAMSSLGARARRHDRLVEDEARAVLEQSLARRRFQTRRAQRETGRPEGGQQLDGTGIAAVEDLEIPGSYRQDLRRATKILKGVGCTEIYLFGSLVDGRMHEASDVDLAVRGCPKRKFFRALGALMMELAHPVDLVDLDSDDLLVRHLAKEGGLVQIG